MKHLRSVQTAGLVPRLTGSKAILLAMLLFPLSGYSSGTVTNLNWLDLDAALSGGGTVTIACDGVIYKPYAAADIIAANTVIDATGHNIVLEGWSGWGGQMFNVSTGADLDPEQSDHCRQHLKLHLK